MRVLNTLIRNYFRAGLVPSSAEEGTTRFANHIPGVRKKPVPWLISHLRSAVPTTHIDGCI